MAKVFHMHNQESLIRFQALLPFYANGTINEVDRRFVDDFLSEYPDAGSQLEFERYLISSMRDPVPERATDAGLNELLKTWQQQLPRKTTFMQRMREIFDEWGLTPAFAVAAVLVVMQSAMLINLQHNNPLSSEMSSGEKFRSMIGIEPAKQFFKLSIAADAEYAQVIQLIKDQGCRIQDGPTQSGALIIACPLGKSIQQQLQSSPLVDDVLPEKAE